MSDELLKKIDEIRTRFDVTYEQARQALAHADGDLIQAMILLEESAREERGEEIIRKIKYFWEQSTKIRLTVSKEEEVLLEFPATIGILGAVLSPRLALWGTVAALAGKCQIQVDSAGRHKQEPGSIDSLG
ncbi:MAG TPA: DUF4342 domain-containing protein [Firmicutes bacterium]|jgi:hypothetical protein|nr:DUF4342 domain-containing protein [Bacillota bacterium]